MMNLLFSCENNDELSQNNLNQKDLIQAIKKSTNKTKITKSDLPDKSENTIQNNYSKSFVNTANYAQHLGYEVKMSNKFGEESLSEDIYFDMNGNELKDDTDMKEMENMKDYEDNFEFIYPINITMPDKSELTLTKEEDWDKVEQWYENNPDSMSMPQIKYPITIKIDGKTKTINSEEELDKLFESMYDGCDFDSTFIDYQFIYPITIKMPDSTFIKVEKEDDFYEIDKWYYKNWQVDEMEEMVFPIQVKRNDSTFTINNNQELLKFEGITDYKDFAYVYPLTYTMPDSSTITIQHQFGWAIFIKWFEQNPKNDKFAELNFPISVKLQDNTTKTINNYDELDKLFSELYPECETKEWNDDDYNYEDSDYKDYSSYNSKKGVVRKASRYTK
jgi:hypothetical protein